MPPPLAYRAAAIAAFMLAGPPALAQQSHDSHATHAPAAKLGTVHFKVDCNAAAQSEFNLAMAYYHSFAWQHIAEPLDKVARADAGCGMVHWARALATLDNPFTWPVTISAKVLNEGPGLLEQARTTGLKTQRERDYVDALAVFFQDPGTRDHRTRAKAFEGALGDLAQALSGRHGGGRPACAHHVRQFRSDRQELHQPVARGPDPGADLQAATAAPRGGALPDPQLRLSTDRQARNRCCTPLCRDRPGCDACASHAIAHLHPGRGLEGLDRIEPGVGCRGPGAHVRQAPRLRLHGLCPPATRAGQGRAAGGRAGQGCATGGPLRLRLCPGGHTGPAGAGAGPVEGGGGPRAVAGCRCVPLEEVSAKRGHQRVCPGHRQRDERRCRGGRDPGDAAAGTARCDGSIEEPVLGRADRDPARRRTRPGSGGRRQDESKAPCCLGRPPIARMRPRSTW